MQCENVDWQLFWTATKSEEEGMTLNIAKYKRDITKTKLPQTVDPLNRTRKASFMLKRLILSKGVEGCHRLRYQIMNLKSLAKRDNEILQMCKLEH